MKNREKLDDFLVMAEREPSFDQPSSFDFQTNIFEMDKVFKHIFQTLDFLAIKDPTYDWTLMGLKLTFDNMTDKHLFQMAYEGT